MNNDLETREPFQLPRATGLSSSDLLIKQADAQGAPVEAVTVAQAFQLLTAADLAVATVGELVSNADAQALPQQSLVAVYAAADVRESGFWLRVADNGNAADWELTDLHYAAAAAHVQDKIDEANAILAATVVASDRALEVAAGLPTASVNALSDVSNKLANASIVRAYTPVSLPVNNNNIDGQFEFAAAFRAGVNNGQTTLKVGTAIDAVAFRMIDRSGLITHITVRVYTRPSDSANVTGNPSQDTTLLIEKRVAVSDIPNFAANDGAGNTGVATFYVDVDGNYKVESGLDYIFAISAQNDDVDTAFTMAFQSIAGLDQHIAGYQRSTAGSNVWTAIASNRKICVAPASAIIADLETVKQVAEAGGAVNAAQTAESLLKPWEIIALRRGGGFADMKIPGRTTDANGLERMFGLSGNWTGGRNRGVEGVDFGCRIPIADLSSPSTLPEFSGNRLRLSASTDTPNDQPFYELKGYHFLGSSINAQFFPYDVVMEDCLFDSNGNAATIPAAFQTVASDEFNLTARFCTFTDYKTNAVFFNNGLIQNCVVYGMEQDGIAPSGGSEVRNRYIDGCLIHVIGQASASHGDNVQTSVTGCIGLSITNTVLYHPSPNSIYAEGTVSGSNEALRVTIHEGIGQDIYAIGSVLVARNAGASMTPRCLDGDVTIESVGFINCVFGTDEYSSSDGSQVATSVQIGVSENPSNTATVKNFVLLGNRKWDGSPPTYDGPAAILAGIDETPRDGIINPDPATMTDKMKEVLRVYGKENGVEILLWNGQINPDFIIADNVDFNIT